MAYRAGEVALAEGYVAHANQLAYNEPTANLANFWMERAIPAIYEFIDRPEMDHQSLMTILAPTRSAQTVLAAIRTRLLGRSELGEVVPAYSYPAHGGGFAETYSLPLAEGMVYQEEYNFQDPNDLCPLVDAVLLRPALLRPAAALSPEMVGPR